MAHKPMRSIPAPPQAEALRQEKLVLLSKHTGDLTLHAVFAVACQLAGQIAAHFDARTTSSQEVIDLLWENFKLGHGAGFETIIAQNGGRN
jgi:hypothetical protein